jgi:hypothetical protein
MKTMLMIAALCVAGLVRVEAQDQPPMPKPTKEHEWLKALDGEWATEGECMAEPGKWLKMKGLASGRSLGGFWNVLENRGEFMGAPFTGIMTLGYDAEKKKYVGTWVDSMTSFLWKYEGSVDASGKILTLDSEGMCPKTAKMTKFQEKIELAGKDSWIFTSAMEDNGKMVQFMKIVYTRKVS